MRLNQGPDEVERLISIDTLDALAIDALDGEADLAAAILRLQPRLVPRRRGDAVGAWAIHEAVRAYTIENGTLEFGQLFGWIDLGTRFALHSVVVDIDTEDELAFDIGAGEADFIVFRPDPALRIIEPWQFGRNGWKGAVPNIVRLDPEAVAADAIRVRRAWWRIQLVDVGPLVLGDPCGAEPERVMAHAAAQLAQGGDYGQRGRPHASQRT